MKVKLTQAGWETYTGQMGVVFFENGLSTKDVLPREAHRIAAAMQAEWEDGSTLSPSELILEHANTPAPVMPLNVLSEPEEPKAVEQPSEDEAVAELAAKGLLPPEFALEPAPERPIYTEAELAAVIDEKGIAGLREIATPLNIKGRSVNEILNELKLNGYVKVE